THDHDEAFAVADRVAVMADGRVLAVDTPERLWRHPVSRQVASFLGYEAFVAPDVRGAAVFDVPGDGELAVAPGAFVLDPDGPVRGQVVRTTHRRGRTEVKIVVDGVGEVTAWAGPGTHAAGQVCLRVDHSAVARVRHMGVVQTFDPGPGGVGGVGSRVRVRRNDDARSTPYPDAGPRGRL
ncbi:MAG: hypothetical protein FWE61_00680, partial [Micrococcales bacterium]|nr:hypothetical protein [Micrococcales bacterium]